MLVHATVEVQLAAHAPVAFLLPRPSFLKLRKLTLMGLMGFPSRDLYVVLNRIKGSILPVGGRKLNRP